MTTKSVAQTRDEERRRFESFLAECPSRDLLETLGGKWVTLILAALGEGPMRYNEIARRVAGISPKMLTQTLRTVERDGLVTREVTPSVPVKVEYELTDLGSNLLSIVLDLKVWAEAHVELIQTARTAYDRPSSSQQHVFERSRASS